MVRRIIWILSIIQYKTCKEPQKSSNSKALNQGTMNLSLKIVGSLYFNIIDFLYEPMCFILCI